MSTQETGYGASFRQQKQELLFGRYTVPTSRGLQAAHDVHQSIPAVLWLSYPENKCGAGPEGPPRRGGNRPEMILKVDTPCWGSTPRSGTVHLSLPLHNIDMTAFPFRGLDHHSTTLDMRNVC